MASIISFDLEFNCIPEQDNPAYNRQDAFLICKAYKYEHISGVQTYALIECFSDKPFKRIGLIRLKEDAEHLAGALLVQRELCEVFNARHNNEVEDHELVKSIDSILNK
jgi:hypothetical protein